MPYAMRTIDPASTPTADLYQYLVGVVNPRPIAFASTLDGAGRPNLAPYSFFNCFSANPPILVFSATRTAAGDGRKDTLRNIEETGEVVINVVTHRIARQMALCSVQFPPGTDEFVKSGLTPLPAERVQPFRVKESPVHMECKLQRVVPLGDTPGSGHLIICEIVRMHLDDAIFDERGRIDPQRLDAMGRLGRAFYVRAQGEAVQRIYQAREPRVLGFDQLPERVRHSPVLTGNELAQLAALAAAPPPQEIEGARHEPEVQRMLEESDAITALHLAVREALEGGEVQRAARLAWLSAME